MVPRAVPKAVQFPNTVHSQLSHLSVFNVSLHACLYSLNPRPRLRQETGSKPALRNKVVKRQGDFRAIGLGPRDRSSQSFLFLLICIYLDLGIKLICVSVHAKEVSLFLESYINIFGVFASSYYHRYYSGNHHILSYIFIPVYQILILVLFS